MVSNVSIFESKADIFLPWLPVVLSCFLPTVCAIPKKGIDRISKKNKNFFIGY